jgi:hypothetical protein
VIETKLSHIPDHARGFSSRRKIVYHARKDKDHERSDRAEAHGRNQTNHHHDYVNLGREPKLKKIAELAIILQ